ncbi:MAG TPA: FAD-dependent oxidoreductase, partial [Burkholderiaceae bacterium]
AALHLPVGPVRGRVTLLAPGVLAELRAGVTGDGYLIPTFEGRTAAGATYETPLPDETDPGAGIDDRAAHDGNLGRLQRLLAAPPALAVGGMFDGLRCVARDRLPVAGAVADEAAALAQAERLRGAHLEDLPRRCGLHAVTALGTRGLALALLMAERVAAQIEGEPWPVERALAAAVDPARFLLRRLR